MKTFVENSFMLHSEAANKLFHEHAEKMPIFDFHCHLSPKEIAEDKHFSDLTELWLSGDHYKWRLMRANGVEEKYITGDAAPYEKFLKWADAIPNCVGNPLYHWTHLELKRYFNIDLLLNSDTAPAIWEACNRQISSPEFSARSIIKQFNVKAVATTDDPIDDLRYHKQISEDKSFDARVLPTFRPDKALHVENKGFKEWIETLSTISGIKIDSLEQLIKALEQRAEFFCSMGCKGADQSFSSPDFTVHDHAAADAAFLSGMSGNKPSVYEVNAYQSELMLALGKIYHRLDFVMQLHLSVVRNNSSRMVNLLGPDTGFDTIGDQISTVSLSALMDGLDKTDELPQTILFTLNDNDNAKLAGIAGCFQSGRIKSKVQFGAAWWFHDHRNGMVKQMEVLADTGLLSSFIGMLTDSRSFLSYTRHEYFRRILCDLLGSWMENSEVPMDFDLMGNIVENICYNNAMDYFHMDHN